MQTTIVTSWLKLKLWGADKYVYLNSHYIQSVEDNRKGHALIRMADTSYVVEASVDDVIKELGLKEDI